MSQNQATIYYPNDFIVRKDINNKLLLLLAYLKINASISGRIGTTLELIIKDIGYTPNRKEGKINDIILDQLSWLLQNNYISMSIDINDITLKSHVDIFINSENDIFQMVNDNGDLLHYFVMVTEDEFNKITKSTTNTNKDILFRVFVNIKKFINFDPITPCICYPSQRTISNDCNISSATVVSAIKELEEIGVLFTYITGKYVDKNGNVKNANNVYAVDPKELDGAEQRMLFHYNSKDGIKVDKFIRDD